jgi:hypothetical protein
MEVGLIQGLPGGTGARKCPQNDPWGVVNSARKKMKKKKCLTFKNNLLSHFIHFQLQILPSYAFKFHQMIR